MRELLTRHGPIAIQWFDTPELIPKAQSEELMRMIHELQPACIVNQRVGNRLGDYRVVEQQIPEAGYSDLGETCMTLNKHWDCHAGDEDWKSAELAVRHLIDHRAHAEGRDRRAVGRRGRPARATIATRGCRPPVDRKAKFRPGFVKAAENVIADGWRRARFPPHVSNKSMGAQNQSVL